ncbi:hypothetical protein PVAND_008695 [Polypedilum vanderplanki]|uniref:DNA-directed RNA polymerase II subunit RPB7 n=1 Tax=Polypedilum vanderplanki TaxID=319348 RepID=A0A9J6CBV5_POLVA|nr:hypothetical protein PVAND_008695 [Polypedilum vanderplanki]
MFYHMQLTHETVVHPIYFGPELMDIVLKKIYTEVEGSCHGNIGYVISITSITEIERGLLVDSGMALYYAKYFAIVFRPFKNEILDGIVKNVNSIGFFAEIGPILCFVSHQSMPQGFRFISKEFPNYFKSEDNEVITIGDPIRIRIIGVRVDQNKMFCIGTIVDDYLGLLVK